MEMQDYRSQEVKMMILVIFLQGGRRIQEPKGKDNFEQMRKMFDVQKTLERNLCLSSNSYLIVQAGWGFRDISNLLNSTSPPRQIAPTSLGYFG